MNSRWKIQLKNKCFFQTQFHASTHISRAVRVGVCAASCWKQLLFWSADSQLSFNQDRWVWACLSGAVTATSSEDTEWNGSVEWLLCSTLTTKVELLMTFQKQCVKETRLVLRYSLITFTSLSEKLKHEYESYIYTNLKWMWIAAQIAL